MGKTLEKTRELEFGGKIGAALMVFGLPLGVYFINLTCNKTDCSVFPTPSISIPTTLDAYFDTGAVLVYLAWFSFQAVLALLPTGAVHLGLPLRSGERLQYRCNAFVSLVCSLAVFALLVWLDFPVTYVYDKYIQLATTAMCFSFVLSVLLYVKSLAAPDSALASGGNSGNLIYDFFIGHELNPRIGQLDLKFFCELRPGLIGWVMLDLCFLVQAVKLYGSPCPAQVMVTLFHFAYVADALWFEEAILTTMDIVHDGFGYMLVFGDLTWVPFLYSLQARYLLEHPRHWAPLTMLAMAAIQVLGYSIFRGANSQKNQFRQNPNDPRVSHLKTMPTSNGKKLLISGWWGLCRHPNYLGDLLMALAWSLPCGFQNILPYFYPIYFLVLLIHRERRDETSCKKKYGHDWPKYCNIVQYRIFPYIY